MFNLEIQPKIVIVVERCGDCNNYYGHEQHKFTRCPYCSTERANKHFAEVERLGRVINSLRGALTRAKKR